MAPSNLSTPLDEHRDDPTDTDHLDTDPRAPPAFDEVKRYRWLSRQVGLGIAEYAVLARLIAHSDDLCQCWPSNRKIAKTLDCSVRAVQRALRGLADKHRIEPTTRRRDNGSQTANMYRLLVRPALIEASKPPKGNDTPHDSQSPPPMTHSHPPHDSQSPLELIPLELIGRGIQHPSTSPRAQVGPVQDCRQPLRRGS